MGVVGQRKKAKDTKKEAWQIKIVLTVEPLGVVFKGALEGVEASSSGQVEEIGTEDDGVRFGELGVGSAVEGRQIARVALLHPHGRRVVVGVKRALGHAQSNARHVLAAQQVRQVGLQKNKGNKNIEARD